MLYAQSAEPFIGTRFQYPEACYRGAPFWSWNTLMTKEMIEKQILEFKKMGMGGFHVHVRVGLKNQYMDDDFLDLVRFCNEKAKENGMLCWLYDEDRYSSGLAGGKVTQNIFYRARWLKLSVHKDEQMLPSFEEFIEKQKQNEKVRGCFLKAYDVVLESGYLKKASIIDENDVPVGTKWYLYIELAKETPWCNNQTYVDTMKQEAIREFINVTHEKYADVLQDDFGKSVPAIFTDEPHINGLRIPGKVEEMKDVHLPYTEALPEIFGTVEGKNFFEAIPYLAWNREGEEACPERYHYFKTLSKMFTDAYCKQIGDWCEEHGLMSTGHLLGEDSLRGQSAIVGDALRCYREFQLPGIDNLCDNRDFAAAKQAASIAHQYRKEGVMSEMYGVTQWNADFKLYKLAGDWQAALGITVRVPHLAWASMNGEAKRDYPAAIGWQSPWYQDFSYLEDHYARVNYCMTRGKPVIHVGMLHPVESFWLLQGPGVWCEAQKKQLEDDFQQVSEWLLTGGVDYDYIAESSLADETAVYNDGMLHVGDMAYQVILVPSCINLRSTTLEHLQRFSQAGGRVIFLGETPRYVDCEKNAALDKLIQESGYASISRQAVLNELDAWREVDILERGVKRTRNLLHQMRQDEDCRWLFIAQAYRGMKGRQEEVWERRPEHAPQPLEIQLKGLWRVQKYDTLNAQVLDLPVKYQGKQTILPYDLYGNDSLLLRLAAVQDPLAATALSGKERKDHSQKVQACYLPEPSGYQMDEPNVLLLDKFEYALDDEPLQAECEMLKLDNRIRERLHMPMRCEALAQPYVRFKEEMREHQVHLRKSFWSDLPVEDCWLALEEAPYCTGTLNGQPIDMAPQGCYVDEAITKVKLPAIRQGWNELCLTIAYGDCTNLEWMYILGDFGVTVKGAHAAICEKPEKLYWGDYTQQGFPFYTGNMTYLVDLPDSTKDMMLQVPYYAGAALKASVNGEKTEMIAFVPNKCKIKDLKEQGNRLQIVCLGHRYNGFGQLHYIGDDLFWEGPNAWRTEGTAWTDTYQLKPMGVLSAPRIMTESSEA